MNIDIYGKTQCPYCDMAKRLAQQTCENSEQGLHTYNYYQLDTDFTREELFENCCGRIDRDLAIGWYNLGLDREEDRNRPISSTTVRDIISTSVRPNVVTGPIVVEVKGPRRTCILRRFSQCHRCCTCQKFSLIEICVGYALICGCPENP